jgi:DNA ligase (NAD+)
MDLVKKLSTGKVSEVISKLSVGDLESVIKIAADSYYNTGISLLSDDVYDLLIERLKILYPGSELLKKTGAPVRGKKTQLPFWMGSMDKIKTEESVLAKWKNEYKGPYLISDKLDGISCLLVFDGKKIKLYTRGDGSFGQDISHLLRYINIDVSGILKYKKEISIRGELIMTKENFTKYENEYSNARNMVGGIVNSKPKSLNTDEAADVDFVVYEIVEPNMVPLEQLKLLEKLDLNVVYYDLYDKINLDILEAILQKRKKKSPYEIDGIIVTDNHKYARNKSGNPPYSFAYKGPSQTADVEVLEVIWRPGKDGYIIPRVRYEKTRLSQADLEYATAFNAKFIVDNGIGPGAIITIVRSGEVIPYILGVKKKAKKPALPDNLKYEWDENGVHIVLLNPKNNESVIIQRLTKFVHDIGVDNMSEGIVTKLVRNGYKNILQIISLTEEDLLVMEGFQKVLAEKIIGNLQASLKQLDLLTLMNASNCFGRGFGQKKLKKILNVYPNIVTEYSIDQREEYEDKIMSLDGFDIKTTNKFLDSLPDFQLFYKKFSKISPVKPYKPKIKKGGLFKDQVVVFTGFRNKDWQDFVESQGGRVTGAVSKNTTLVVYKDGEESTDKYRKAKQFGIKLIPKSKFPEEYGLE